MPTPPKESIKGAKRHEIAALDFSQKTYDYIVSLEDFKNSSGFEDLEQKEKDYINEEIGNLNSFYSDLNERLDLYS